MSSFKSPKHERLSEILLTPQQHKAKIVKTPKKDLTRSIDDSTASSKKATQQLRTEPDSFTVEREAARREFLSSSQLPSVAEIINTKPKNISPEVSRTLLELTKYAQHLEHTVRSKEKEIQRLQYINKYLTLAQQSREQLIIQTLEENRKLKELNFINDKTSLKKNPNLGSLTLRSQQSQVQHSKQWLVPPGESFQEKAQNNPSDRKSSSALSQRNQSLNNFSRKERKKQSAYRKREEEINLLYQENENLSFLEGLLKDEDTFMQEVPFFEKEKFTKLYEALQTLKTDHTALREMVVKLRRIIKATITMTTSLLLDEASERIIDETCECLDCDRATAFIYDSSREELWSKIIKGSDETIRVPVNKGIVGHVFSKGEALNIPNAYLDERFNKAIDAKSGYKTNTILTVPIKDDNAKIIGVLQAVNKKGPGAVFTKDDEDLLTILSNLAGVVLRNSMTYNEQLSVHHVLRSALKTGVALNSFHNLNQLIPFAEKKLKNLMRIDKVKIALIHPAKDELFSIGSNGASTFYPLSTGIMGKVMMTGELENITNGYNHSLFNGLLDIETSMPLLCVPIKDHASDRILGALQVINTKGVQGLSALERANIHPLDLETLDFFTKNLGQAILNCYREGKNQARLRGESYDFDHETRVDLVVVNNHLDGVKQNFLERMNADVKKSGRREQAEQEVKSRENSEQKGR